MIYYRCWVESKKYGVNPIEREGWYLFGILPLYVRDRTVRNLRK